MNFLERILNKIGQEWEIFMTECNLMSKPGIISKVKKSQKRERFIKA